MLVSFSSHNYDLCPWIPANDTMVWACVCVSNVELVSCARTCTCKWASLAQHSYHPNSQYYNDQNLSGKRNVLLHLKIHVHALHVVHVFNQVCMEMDQLSPLWLTDSSCYWGLYKVCKNFSQCCLWSYPPWASPTWVAVCVHIGVVCPLQWSITDHLADYALLFCSSTCTCTFTINMNMQPISNVAFAERDFD